MRGLADASSVSMMSREAYPWFPRRIPIATSPGEVIPGPRISVRSTPYPVSTCLRVVIMTIPASASTKAVAAMTSRKAQVRDDPDGVFLHMHCVQRRTMDFIRLRSGCPTSHPESTVVTQI